MKFYMVWCPCCPINEQHLFLQKKDAIDRAANREEFNQEVYELEISEENLVWAGSKNGVDYEKT